MATTVSKKKTMTPQQVLDFWFVQTTPQQHFTKSDRFDQRITKLFEETYWGILVGESAHWRKSAKGRLAEIIVLDQFARNMFRAKAQAFAADRLALQLAQEAVALGADQKVPKKMRGSFYMPYMHSESKSIHKDAVKLFSQPGLETNLEYEYKHKAIIDRFGRYPHRNEALGRTSSAAEKKFIAEQGGF